MRRACHIGGMKTYRVVPECRPGLEGWAIQMVVDGVPQPGLLHAGFLTEEAAQAAVKKLVQMDAGGDHL